MWNWVIFSIEKHSNWHSRYWMHFCLLGMKKIWDFWWIAWYLIAFLFICLLVADVKITQNIAWNWFERLSFVALLTQVFIIFFFYYLFILHSFYFLCDFYIFKILQELFIIVWYLFKMIILVTDWFLLHKLILQLIVL